MKFKLYLLVLFIFSAFSCTPSQDEEETLTATINGEEWEFFEINVNREPDGMKIQAMGYLEGDGGAIPVNLKIDVIEMADEGPISTPYVAYFAPNTQDLAARATIEPTDKPVVFDTELDVNSRGRFVITEATDSIISGEFNFIATDKSGRRLEVENGRFNNLRL